MNKSDRDLDKYWGFNIEDIENGLFIKAREARPSGTHHTLGHYLHQGNQTWVGLDSQTLQTPYNEIEKILKLLSPGPGSHFVDLGAGYGRLGLVLKKLYPEVVFTGYEFVSERVEEGKRVFRLHGLDPDMLKLQDLTDPQFVLPKADFYFLYDYGNVRDIRHTLKQIEIMADEKKLTVIARGFGSRSLIEHEFPWLSQVYPPHHEKNFSIYFMAN